MQNSLSLATCQVRISIENRLYARSALKQTHAPALKSSRAAQNPAVAYNWTKAYPKYN